MYFRHILAKIQPKSLKQHFDWGGGGGDGPLGFDLDLGYISIFESTISQKNLKSL